jgi:ubiquinone/menaquinone biosynthesis C-methylase UbiE
MSARTPRVGFVLCAAEALPFSAASFDAAVATLVLCTVDAPYKPSALLARSAQRRRLPILSRS